MPFKFVSWVTCLTSVKNKTKALTGMVGITNSPRFTHLAIGKAPAVLILIFLLLPAVFSHADPGKHSSKTVSSTTLSTNVILFIGDGMDEHQITMARNYLYGADGAFSMEQMPVRSSVQVHTLREDNPNQFRYVADSGNTASTLATGLLTSKGRISTSAAKDVDQETILEAAQKKGYRTGLVSTASLTDATPAAFAAHTSHRSCQSTNNMAGINPIQAKTQQCVLDLKVHGGSGSIAEQLATANIDVLLGGGMALFDQPVEGGARNLPSILDMALDHGHLMVKNAAELNTEKLQAASQTSRLLGLFAPVHLPVEWQGEQLRRAELITIDNKGKAIFPTPFGCEKNPHHNGTPTLAKMTARALQVLSQNNNQGFFLMVEGASIDKQAHIRNPCGQIGELRAFDQAVTIGRQFAQQYPNTLIIVTADHGQAGQIVPLPESYQAASKAVHMAQYPTGHYAVLKTLSGELMAINYATNSSPQGLWGMHTGTNVPAYMEGPGLDDIPALIDQRDINQLMRHHLKLP
ncbi:MAG TPA: alkaline phosphatase [Porticoccus sp.]|nr:alkaline phosphatase [Porticoccus sp.]